MSREAIQDDIGTDPPDPLEVERLKTQVLELANRINTLTDEYHTPIEDIGLAQAMAQETKPYIDRLISLNRLLNPVDRIVAKREQIQELQSEIAEDVAEVEVLAGGIGEEVNAGIINDLQGEIASVKKDRKLFVSQAAAGEDGDAPTPSGDKKKSLGDLPLPERFQRIFGQRFIDLPQLEILLGLRFASDQRSAFYDQLERVWHWLLSRDELLPHIERNSIKTLHATFADYALLMRSPLIADAHGEEIPCNLAALRTRFNDFFVGGSERGLWYTNMPFYHKPIAKGHWVLLDRQYLNCTFKKPSIRLLMYARANGLSAKQVRQKSVTEDIYDRILLELALKERFVDNCHSITSTTYQPNAKSSTKQVYTFYKDSAIRISGKSGIPHWRPSKPRWPGVLPSLIVSQ